MNNNTLPDVQKTKPTYTFEITSVGICNFEKEMKIQTKAGDFVSTLANIKIGTSLNSEVKGTHMSRFGQVIEECLSSNIENNNQLLTKLSMDIDKRFLLDYNTDHMQIEIEFKYPLKIEAPVSKIKSTIYPKIKFKYDTKTGENNIIIYHTVTTCCPCSKEISEYGAHNQRAQVILDINVEDEIYWFEDLIEIINKSGSSILYPILKREDEKHVTEKAYENPMFVEDVVRNINHNLLETFPNINKYFIHVESEESIHFHNAYATIDCK